jgi:hypothetical protein
MFACGSSLRVSNFPVLHALSRDTLRAEQRRSGSFFGVQTPFLKLELPRSPEVQSRFRDAQTTTSKSRFPALRTGKDPRLLESVRGLGRANFAVLCCTQ